MLFVFEGLSRSGKSTLMKIVHEKLPDSIVYDGFSLLDIGQSSWDEYIELEHKILNRLNKMNISKPILTDRSFSEFVYAPDGDKWLRTFEHHKARIIFVKCSKEELEKRNTKDAKLEEHEKKYEELLKHFKHFVIDSDKRTKEDCALGIILYIGYELDKENAAQKEGAKS